MATLETQKLDSIIASRRALLMGGGAVALAAFIPGGVAKAAVPATFTDADILNFALNLEYLEAQFYTLATEGRYADKSLAGAVTTTGAGTATGTGSTSATLVLKPNTSTVPGQVIAPVPFTSSSVAAYAFETALEERRHVNFLKTALSTAAVAQPSLDLVNSFYALGSLLSPSIPNFDPFANDLNFLLGAYIFEDVGVSAYHGAAALIKDPTSYLGAAAGIQAVEAYHSGLVRSSIAAYDAGIFKIPGESRTGASGLTVQISGIRALVDGTSTTATPDDIGVTTKTVALNGSSATFNASTIANADANYIAWSRTFRQVLNIVYASPGAPTKGAFFPNGLNGNIS
jgi:hypothetical protein